MRLKINSNTVPSAIIAIIENVLHLKQNYNEYGEYTGYSTKMKITVIQCHIHTKDTKCVCVCKCPNCRPPQKTFSRVVLYFETSYTKS
jgi:hypothetical protein